MVLICFDWSSAKFYLSSKFPHQHFVVKNQFPWAEGTWQTAACVLVDPVVAYRTILARPRRALVHVVLATQSLKPFLAVALVLANQIPADSIVQAGVAFALINVHIAEDSSIA